MKAKARGPFLTVEGWLLAGALVSAVLIAVVAWVGGRW